MSKPDFERTPDNGNTAVEHHLKVKGSLIIPCGDGFNIGSLQDADGHIYLKIDPATKDILALEFWAGGRVQVFTGTQGPAGADGAQGANGLSAYEIWLQEGNTGSPTDFINSLKGAKGDTGTTGPAGADGVQGPKGDKGEQGPQGIQGIQGPAGANGRTPEVYVQTTDPATTNTVYPGDTWINQ